MSCQEEELFARDRHVMTCQVLTLEPCVTGVILHLPLEAVEQNIHGGIARTEVMRMVCRV